MTQATQQAVSRVEAVINRQWAKMVKWQESRGCKWSLFDAEDTVQRASLLLFKWATDGKYDGKTDKEYPIVDPQERQFKSDDATYCYFTKNNLYYDTGTASQSGTTITGVGTTFTSAMVGKQIRFDSGETATIITYTSATSLEASVSQTVASSAFKITGSGYVLNLNPAPTSTLNGLDIEYAYYKNPTKWE